MLDKRISLSTHQVQVAFIAPKKMLREDLFLVFLHEALGSIGQWRNFPQLLCDSLGVQGFMYERRGHGASDPLDQPRNERYLHEYAYQELPDLLQQLIPAGKKVILAGHSDGGTIALLYAARFPKLVAGIVTMAAHVINEAETRAGIPPAIEAYRAGKLDGLRKYHEEKAEALFFAWADTWLSESFLDWDITEDIRGISCPALIIQGKQDQYGTPRQVELITSIIPGSRGMILENCKHHPHLEKTEEVASLISDYLKNKI